MNEYINRDKTINAIKSLESSMPANDNYAKGYDAAIGRALIAVRDVPTAADVQPVDRWISVDDKMPEQDEKVLVLTKDKDIMTMIYKVIPFRWYKPKFGGFDKDYVTHWKPLKDGDNNA